MPESILAIKYFQPSESAVVTPTSSQTLTGDRGYSVVHLAAFPWDDCLILYGPVFGGLLSPPGLPAFLSRRVRCIAPLRHVRYSGRDVGLPGVLQRLAATARAGTKRVHNST